MQSEKELAGELYGALIDRCPAGTDVTVDGKGIWWHCVAQRSDRYCSMACRVYGGGPQYLCYYRIGTGIDATGWSTSLEETVQAAARWMECDSVAEMQRRFPFVDAEMKALAALKEALIGLRPELAAVSVLRESSTRVFSIQIETGDRSCSISYKEHDPIPCARFRWRDIEVIETHSDDRSLLAALSKAWVCDRVMPSTLRAEFPAVEISKVADYFEAGRMTEGEFVASWIDVEEFYRDLLRIPHWARLRPVSQFITELRRAAFHETLRAGTSMTTLMVSRSRQHGLRADQPYVAFEFLEKGMNVRSGGREEMRLDAIALTPEVESILRELARHPID